MDSPNIAASTILIELLTKQTYSGGGTVHLGYTTLCKIIGVRGSVCRKSSQEERGGRKYFPSHELGAHDPARNGEIAFSRAARRVEYKVHSAPFG